MSNTFLPIPESILSRLMRYRPPDAWRALAAVTECRRDVEAALRRLPAKSRRPAADGGPSDAAIMAIWRACRRRGEIESAFDRKMEPARRRAAANGRGGA
jgi:hypothetical protein